jgi:hypothetical protein
MPEGARMLVAKEQANVAPMSALRLMYRHVLDVMPSSLSSLVRRCVSASNSLFRSRSTVPIAPNYSVAGVPEGTNPFDFVNPETLKLIFDNLTANPEQLLQIGRVREIIARERAEHLLSMPRPGHSRNRRRLLQ